MKINDEDIFDTIFTALNFQGENKLADYPIFPSLEEQPRNILHVCPTCKGSGFFDGHLPATESVKEQNNKAVNTSSFSVGEGDLPVALPKIKCPINMRPNLKVSPSPKYKPIVNQRSSDNTLPLLPMKNHTTFQGLTPPNTTKNNNLSLTERKLPPIHSSRSRMSSASSEGGGDVDLIEAKEIDNKPEFIKRTKVKLKSTNLLDISTGVIDVVHLAKIDETVAYTFMPQVNRHLCTMLRCLKVKIVRQACQAINQLFGKVSHVSRPEFDDIVVLLLVRTADSNKYIRKDASAALDVIVASTPPQVVVRAIHSKGPRSKNPQVRLTTAKIMCTLVKLVGYETLLNHPALHEMRRRVLETGCVLLNDHNIDVRATGRELMSNFVMLDDFEEALLIDVPQNIIKKVEKSIICLRVELLKAMDLLKTGGKSSE